MRQRPSIVTIVLIAVYALLASIATEVLADIYMIPLTILTTLVAVYTGYIFYKYSAYDRKLATVSKELMNSNKALHEKYMSCYKYDVSKNGIIGLLKTLAEIDFEYRDYFESNDTDCRKTIDLITPIREKNNDTTFILLSPEVLGLPHDLANKIIEAFGKNYWDLE